MRLLVAEAYEAGARYVHLRWLDPLSARARYRHVRPEYLDFVPGFEEAWRKEYLAEGWSLLRLTGEEYPGALEEVDPALMRREQAAWSAKHKFFQEAVMNNAIAWCVAAVPTPAWARQGLPGAWTGRRRWAGCGSWCCASAGPTAPTRCGPGPSTTRR